MLSWLTNFFESSNENNEELSAEDAQLVKTLIEFQHKESAKEMSDPVVMSEDWLKTVS